MRAFDGLLKATEPFYIGAHRHPQMLGFISISKVGNPCFISIDMVYRLKRNTDTHTNAQTHTSAWTHTQRTHTHTPDWVDERISLWGFRG